MIIRLDTDSVLLGLVVVESLMAVSMSEALKFSIVLTGDCMHSRT